MALFDTCAVAEGACAVTFKKLVQKQLHNSFRDFSSPFDLKSTNFTSGTQLNGVGNSC